MCAANQSEKVRRIRTYRSIYIVVVVYKYLHECGTNLEGLLIFVFGNDIYSRGSRLIVSLKNLFFSYKNVLYVIGYARSYVEEATGI